jgi:hypothetical protein
MLLAEMQERMFTVDDLLYSDQWNKHCVPYTSHPHQTRAGTYFCGGNVVLGEVSVFRFPESLRECFYLIFMYGDFPLAKYVTLLISERHCTATRNSSRVF